MAQPAPRRQPAVIALSGPLCAGKTTVARYLADVLDFAHIRSRRILELELEATDTPVTREHLQRLGQHVQDTRGELWMTQQILAQIPDDTPTVVDAVRHVASLSSLRRALGERFHSVHVTAPDDLRVARFLARDGSTAEDYLAASSHAVEAETGALEAAADVTLSNRGALLEFSSAIAMLAHVWLWNRAPVTFALALATIEDFHRKHGFEVGTGTAATLQERLPLVIEELGEVARWATRGEGDLAEEHADLVILILGNAIAMGLDIEDALVAKLRKILARTSRAIHGRRRVSHWGARPPDATTRIDSYRLGSTPPPAPHQEHAPYQPLLPFPPDRS